MSRNEKVRTGVIVGVVVIVVLLFALHQPQTQTVPAEQPQLPSDTGIAGGPLPVIGYDMPAAPGISMLFNVPGVPPLTPLVIPVLNFSPYTAMGDVYNIFNIPTLPEVVLPTINLPDVPPIELTAPTIVLNQLAPDNCGTPSCGCGSDQQMMTSMDELTQRIIDARPTFEVQYAKNVIGPGDTIVTTAMNGRASPQVSPTLAWITAHPSTGTLVPGQLH